MENLLKKLQEEAGLTEEQALKTISVFKDFMDKEGLEIDWKKFFKGKYEDLSDNAKSLFDELSSKVRDLGNKLSDKAEDVTTDAKRKIRDISNKISDKMDD